MANIIVISKRGNTILCYINEGKTEPKIPFLASEDPLVEIRDIYKERGYKVGYLRKVWMLETDETETLYEVWACNVWDLENPKGVWCTPEEIDEQSSDLIKRIMQKV